MWFLNFGKEFKRQMKGLFDIHPEINHKWASNHLMIYYPSNNEEFVDFTFGLTQIEISNSNTSKVFRRKIFTNLKEQVSSILLFGLKTLQENTDSNKPILQTNQVSVMQCNAKYGQVLTLDSNRYIGWGEIYRVFNNIEKAREFCKLESNSENEFHIYDPNYIWVESINVCGESNRKTNH